jgi:hypothetical protein
VPHPLQRISNEARAFTQLRPAGTGSARLFSGGGNRFDYWRIAWKEFRDHPVKGVGAGSYDAGYFLQRRTTEDITQPHSIELQALSELGLVGGIAVLGLIGGVLAGFLRRVARARRSSTDAGIAVAAGGIFLTWLVHTSVDWLHLIPGITGVALGAGAALVAPGRPARAGRRYPARLMAVALCAGLVAVGALFVARITLADHYQSQARAEVARNPARALDRAGQALALEESSSTRYVQAAAFARQGDYPNARGSLLEVTRSEPHNFVPWALLGDLAVRRRDLAEARRDYTRAHRLDPRNPELARLARDPSTATGSAVTP